MEKKQENGKKRSIIIVAMILLLLLMIAFCGYTFAKYISEQEVTSNTARTAKWGFIITANGNNALFKETYATTGDGAVTLAATDTAGEAIVAPGTSGSMTFSVTGKAEVLAQISLTAAYAQNGGADQDITLTEGTNVYKPIVWTLKKATGTAPTDWSAVTAEAAATNKSLSEIQTYISGLSSDLKIAAGTNANVYFELTWSWAFDTDDNPASDNRKDTLLGFAAAGNGTYENGKVTVSGTTVTDNADAQAPDTSTAYTAQTNIGVVITISVEQVNE